MRNLGTVDVAAVRLWLDRKVQASTPSNVMARFDEGVGATFFDLNALQVMETADGSANLWSKYFIIEDRIMV